MRVLLVAILMTLSVVPPAEAEEPGECIHGPVWKTFGYDQLTKYEAKTVVNQVYYWQTESMGGGQWIHVFEVVEEDLESVSGFYERYECGESDVLEQLP